MRIAGLLLVTASTVAVLGCTPPQRESPAPAGRTSHTIVVGGQERTFQLYRPASLADGSALVVMLHGGFGTARQAQAAYGWDDLAEREGFVVAYPDGFDRAWAVGGGCCGKPGRAGTDDVGFITALVAKAGQLAPIDPGRVFATGMSNGAMMSYRLACDTGLIAAIGPVAGAGHQWPGAAGKPVAERILGTDPPSTALDATEIIWRFFDAHSRQ